MAKKSKSREKNDSGKKKRKREKDDAVGISTKNREEEVRNPLLHAQLSILCATHSGTSLGHIVLFFRCTILGIFGYTDQKSGSTPMESKQWTIHEWKNRRLDATNETEPNARRRKKRRSWQLSRRNEKEQLLLLPTNASIGRSESSNNKQQQTPTKLTATRTMKIPLLLSQRLA